MTVVGSKKMVVYDNDTDSKIAIYDKGIDRKAVLGQNMDYDNPRAQSFNHREGEKDEPLHKILAKSKNIFG